MMHEDVDDFMYVLKNSHDYIDDFIGIVKVTHDGFKDVVKAIYKDIDNSMF